MSQSAMTLHVFNPSHDEALAAGTPYYTPTLAAKRMAEEQAFLPLFYAADGDAVVIPDACVERIPQQKADMPRVEWVAWSALPRFLQKNATALTAIAPWGWNHHIAHRLHKAGVPEHLLPAAEQLDAIRRLSSRKSAVELLPLLRAEIPHSIGSSRWCTSEAETLSAIKDYGGKAMLKAPWSCSGRGVFPVELPLSASLSGRLNRILTQQGAVEVEPLYERVLDFAMEFEAKNDGSVCFEGLSLFKTDARGAYLENIIAPDEVLAARIYAAGCPCELSDVAEKLCSALPHVLKGQYAGPLGVDMMPVRSAGSVWLHPCVEINLRRTMGSVVIARRGFAVSFG